MEISSSTRSSFIDLQIIIILLVSPLLPTAAISDDNNQYHGSSCYGDQTYPHTSFYENRKHLMNILSLNTPSHHGFANASSAMYPNDPAYGLALCRGDISVGKNLHQCTKCLAEAIANTDCKYNRGGIIYYDHCLLKFSDQKFFGQIDTDHNRYTCSGNSASNMFAKKIKVLLNKLAGEVAENTKFAYRNGGSVVYAMVQCTRDLDLNKCKGCLKNVMNDISTLTDCLPKTSGNFFYGSCVVRYDTNRFLF